MSRDMPRRSFSRALLLSSLGVTSAAGAGETNRRAPEQDSGGARAPIHLEGTPTDELPDVLATGRTSIRFAFISFSARDPNGRDAEYIEWHTLDHRPEQYRLPELRNSLRLVSTPACRKARAASVGPFDSVDHVMTYLFASTADMPAFSALGGALNAGGRMPHRLPSVGFATGTVAGKVAAPRAVTGADVIPWRPAAGVYLMVEEGHAPAGDLVNVAGVAGVWWYQGTVAPAPFKADSSGRQITYCYIERDLLATSERLNIALRRRWASGAVKGLLAAPFYSVVPFDWNRYLPG
jgi:hypothetical protein